VEVIRINLKDEPPNTVEPAASPPGDASAVRCPLCGSTDTQKTSECGACMCKSLHECRTCGEPFDHLKDHYREC
jgi:ring-1,2-phenylacetyl-CoA epoxidase subunit PaaD